MRSGRFWLAAVVAGVGLAAPLAAASAPAGDELGDLRQQLESLRREYDQRIQALEERVRAAEASARRSADRGAAPAPASSANAFNPAVSLILQGRLAGFSGPDGHREFSGILVGPETGRGPEGFSLGESELDISANIDDKFYGFFDVAFNQEDGGSAIEIEEAYLQTLALSGGFTVKAGQFFSRIGYQNARHSHAWDFVDQPLAYEALLDGQWLDVGVQLSWVAPTDLYLEVGGELFRGAAFPAGGAAHDGLGAATAFAKLGGDVGAGGSWKAGLAYLTADPRDRESSDLGLPLLFSGNSDVWVADFVFKWAPNGNIRDRNLTLQAELLRRHERGRLRLLDPAGELAGSYRGDQLGFYVQGAYQFVPRWRFGMRYGQLSSDNRVVGLPPTLLARDADTPRRLSAMLDFSNSEFSRFRLQYSHEGGGLSDEDLVFFQYIMSLGSHGAHEF